MFSLDLPSEIQFKIPTWDGFTQLIGGSAQATGHILYDGYSAVVDPVKKIANRVQGEAQEEYYLFESSAYSSLGNILEGAQDAVKSAGETVKSGISTAVGGIAGALPGWLKIALAAGIALYALSVLSPFLRKNA